ncbi:MAG: RDD family protein [Gammaproteobacteria bacterium]|nr:RDD family protein [Gammaproteobacteria bacterium]TVQ46726.1 MAG: RDD family protein [Gammaproteobacteria bacterium]
MVKQDTDSLPAGLIRRLAALVYDALLVIAVLMVVGALVAAGVMLALGGEQGALYPAPLWFRLLMLGALGGAWYLLFGWFWTHGGATLGMQAWHLQVQRSDGGPLDWRLATLRFAAAGLSLASLGVGYLWMLFDSQRRTWHDILSDTRTVRVVSSR